MAEGGGGKVKSIQSDSEFQKELVLAAERLVVVDFFATWCGPCKTIAPKFNQLSTKYETAVFLRADVEICKNTALRYGVKSMPTFIFFHKQGRLDQVCGADAVALESGILKNLGNIEGGSQSDGPSASTAKTDSSSTSLSIPGQVLLNSVVDMSGSECLNESDDHVFAGALSDGKSYLESDCDEQLILSLGFHQAVKLHSLQLLAPPDGSAPKTIKIFINQTHTIDFDTAESNSPVQMLTVSPDDMSEESAIGLNYLKFQNVQNLTIFIRDNQGGNETTVVQYIGIYGNILDSTNMKDFKRVAGDKGETH